MAVRVQFGDQLRQELARQNLSQRELARRLSGERDGDRFKHTRRLVHKWLMNEHRPRRANRARVAVALGLELDHFGEDEDEEDQLADLVLQLVAQIRLDIHDAVDRRLGIA